MDMKRARELLTLFPYSPLVETEYPDGGTLVTVAGYEDPDPDNVHRPLL